MYVATHYIARSSDNFVKGFATINKKHHFRSFLMCNSNAVYSVIAKFLHFIIDNIFVSAINQVTYLIKEDD